MRSRSLGGVRGGRAMVPLIRLCFIDLCRVAGDTQ